MQNKHLWLATTAIALLGAAPQARADGVYVSVLGGANWLNDQSGRLGGPSSFVTYTADPDTGFVLGGVIGGGLDNWVRGLRVEMEASYRRQDVGGAWTSSAHTGTIDANQSTFAIMANAWYDIELGWKIKPYIGGGVGWARSNWEVAFLDSTNDLEGTADVDNSGFAWQLGLGFNYEVGAGVDVGLGYRYFDGPGADYRFITSHENVPATIDNENHGVMVNLTIETN